MDSLEGPGGRVPGANSFEKSSSHWQARDEYLSDIK